MSHRLKRSELAKTAPDAERPRLVILRQLATAVEREFSR
jgi:hypothetical protein